jgi:hypothetical protein
VTTSRRASSSRTCFWCGTAALHALGDFVRGRPLAYIRSRAKVEYSVVLRSRWPSPLMSARL